MSTDDKPCQATPSANLRQQIMDSRVPKNECEWWASRTITKLETELAAMQARAERAEAALEEQKWLKECAMKRTGEVMAERDALAKDKARMDWLEKESPEDWGIRSINRAAIDKAMKEASK